MMRLAFLLVVSACVPPPSATPINWQYGGESWGGVCAIGKHQSPAALSGGAGFAPKLHFEYWPSHIKFINDGHMVHLDYDPGSYITVNDKKHTLQQIQFHHPGEHSIDGQSYPLEIHLVHKSEDGKLAVVAVLVTSGAFNRWMRPFLEDPPRPGETREPTARVNAADLVPLSRVFLHYSGSLTMPPCTEGVEWFVLRTPIEMSAAQIEQLGQILGDTHRPIQPLGDRKIIEGEVR